MSLIGKTIKTVDYKCLWCKGKEFYVDDEIHVGIYLNVYCIDKNCGCNQVIKIDEFKYEVCA